MWEVSHALLSFIYMEVYEAKKYNLYMARLSYRGNAELYIINMILYFLRNTIKNDLRQSNQYTQLQTLVGQYYNFLQTYNNIKGFNEFYNFSYVRNLSNFYPAKIAVMRLIHFQKSHNK